MDHNEEIRSTLEQIKAQLKAKPENKEKSDDEISEMMLDGFLKAFDNGEMEKDDLFGIMDLMGYEPTEEFKSEVEKNEGATPDLANATKEELEDVREMPEDKEGQEEFKEDISDLGGDIEEDEDEDEESYDDDEEEEDEVPDDDEDAQRERASKLFGTDLTKK